MSKTTLVTDPDVLQSLTFKRPAQSADADGLYSGAPTTLEAATGDLQPVQGELRMTATGLDPAATHMFFPATRLTSGVVQGDVADDAGGTRYRVVHVADPGATYLQEVQLEELNND